MRKSQSGMNAAMLVAVLAALIIIYIIFLPSDKRLNIIGENETDGDDDNDDEEDILVEDEELIMEVIGQDEIDHDLPSISLFTRTEATTIKEENSIYVKNGLFDKEDKAIEFKIFNTDNIKNLLMSFDAKKSKGRLIITLNGYEIFNNKIDKVNVEPIKISKDYIAANNQLRFEVSGVGAAFWSTNEFLLENFKISADFTDTSTQEATTTFIISEAEASNIEGVELRFVPECQQKDVGILEVTINENTVYSSVPDCGIAYPMDFSPIYLLRGENKLIFRSEKGRFLIDQVKITTQLKEQPSYSYFFKLKSDELKDIKDENKQLNLSFYFSDDESDKEAEIYVNGLKEVSMRLHQDAYWSTLISDDELESGSNSLKIIPKERLEIRKLQLILQDTE